MNAAKDEVLRLWAELEKVRGPTERKKSGRPTIWKGSVGSVLVEAVEEIIIRKLKGEEDGEEGWVDLHDPEDYGLLQMACRVHAHKTKGTRRLYNLAQVIRKAVRTDPILQQHKEVFGRLSDRALQARYQQAADYWSKAREEPREREREAAMDRWTEAIERVNKLCDLLDMLDD